jgi:hypothetical protein
VWAVEYVENRVVPQKRIPISNTLRRSLGTLRAALSDSVLLRCAVMWQ